MKKNRIESFPQGLSANADESMIEADIRRRATLGLDEWMDARERRNHRLQYAAMLLLLLALPVASFALVPKPSYRSLHSSASQVDRHAVCEQAIVIYQKALRQ